VIVDPINDTECLVLLTTLARELARTTLVRDVARRLGTRETTIEWFQSLPQSDDFGDEHVRMIQCDVPQRTRLLPDDPNCVERSFGALMLFEAIDPKTTRALATVDKPLRHTGLVEKTGQHWRAVDLFPRRNAQRNFDWDSFGRDVLQGTHTYVGKPILKFYLGDAGGRVADSLGEQEDKLIGRDKKQPEKKPTPPPAAAQRPDEQPRRPQRPRPQRPAAQQTQSAGGSSLARPVGAGANQEQAAPVGGRGKNGEEEKGPSGAGATTLDGAGAGSHEATEGSDRDSHDARTVAQRFWQSLGR
jgi:hypothetical protein